MQSQGSSWKGFTRIGARKGGVVRAEQSWKMLHSQVWRQRMGLWAKECRQLSKAAKDKESEPTERIQLCWHLDFKTSDLQNSKQITLPCLKQLNWWSFGITPIRGSYIIIIIIIYTNYQISYRPSSADSNSIVFSLPWSVNYTAICLQGLPSFCCYC